MTLQQLYEQTPPQQRALQFGVDGGDALTGAFPQKRVVHAGLRGSLVSPEESQKIWQDLMGQAPTGKEVQTAYIHIPFCKTKCLYCGFFQNGMDQSVKDEYIRCLVRELRQAAKARRLRDSLIHAVFIGGGTPTCLPLPVLEAMMTRLARNFPAAREWTVEAGRPDTATPDMLAMLRQAGVDRISVNPQTLQQHLLDALGRRHRVEDIYTMYENCRKLGFSVNNMDFIAGLPGQTVADMQENMEIVCKLHPENVTIHTLALKKRAPLFHHELRAAIPPAEETGHMVRLCQSILTAGGYVPYYMYRQKYMAASFANIGYALPGSVSAYNIEMMEERQSVLAAGPGGATKFLCRDGHTLEKVYMPKDVDAYVQALAERIAQRRRLCAIIYGKEDV